MHYKLALVGFGNVGKALVELLFRKEEELRAEGITFSIVAIASGAHGRCILPSGLTPQNYFEHVRDAESLNAFTQVYTSSTLDLIEKCEADVLFENSPVNYHTGQPAIDHLRAALNQGMHAITANKGPVVHAYRELTQLAAKHHRRFLFESTVMDGAPIFSLFRGALPGARLLGFKAILNSTTNLILSLMEQGKSFDEAVLYSQQAGLAETDPSGDIDGWDAAVKIAALATVLMDTPTLPDQIDRTGIRGITPQNIADAKAQGMRYKLICTAERTVSGLQAKVAPHLVEPGSPFYTVEGSTSIIEFHTDTLTKLTLIENDPTPFTTAYGLLADFITAARGDILRY
jgi:homoserine dehydrogenase